MKFVEIFGKVEDSCKFLVNKLTKLGSPFIIRADKSHIDLLDKRKLFPLLTITTVLKELLIQKGIGFLISEFFSNLDFYSLKKLSKIWIDF